MKKRSNQKIQWIIFLSLIILLTIAGTFGFINTKEAGCNIWEAVYLSLQLFVLQSGHLENHEQTNFLLHLARILSPLILAYFTISFFSKLFLVDLKLFIIKKHIVICGISDKSIRIMKDCLDKKQKVVVIDNSSAQIGRLDLEARGVIFINEHPTDKSALKKAKIKRAKYIFILNDIDEFNIEIALKIFNLFGTKESEKKVICYIHIYEKYLEEVFKSHQIYQKKDDKLEARLINIYDQGIEYLTDDHPLQLSESKDVATKSESHDGYTKILIIGLGWMGKSILKTSSIYNFSITKKKIQAVIIERNTKREIRQFKDDFLLTDELIDFNLSDKDFREMEDEEFINLKVGNCFNAIYICAGDNIERLRTGEKLRKIFPESKVFVCFKDSSDLTKLINECGLKEKDEKLIVYDLLSKTCNFDNIVNSDIEKMAEEIHNIYCHEEEKKGETVLQNSALVLWNKLDYEYQESNRKQAANIRKKLHALGYKIEINNLSSKNDPNIFNLVEIEKLAEAEHIRWGFEKRLKGWTKGVKNLAMKINPLIGEDYINLPKTDKDKNRATVKFIPQILDKVNWKIIKK